MHKPVRRMKALIEGLPMLLSKMVLFDGCIVVIDLEDSRNDLPSCDVCTKKADHSDHCPTTIRLFSVLWIVCVTFDKLRLCFTAKNVLLAVFSDYLRRRTCHYCIRINVNKCKAYVLSSEDTVRYGLLTLLRS